MLGMKLLKNRFIYVDNASTTKISDSCFNAMLPYFKENFGNPSSVYALANVAKNAIENARQKIAAAINAEKEEIFFTSCGTESNNWAIKGAAKLGVRKNKNHIITTNFEHHSVLNSFKRLEKEGFNVTYLPIDKNGIIDACQLEAAITSKTALVSIMNANNEIGTILPIEKFAAICKKKDIPFHTDAVQAIGHLNIDVKKQNISMLSASGHKINAPKGIGFLYVEKNIKLPNLLDGGGQEKGFRGGTENVAFIVGMAHALENATKDIEKKEKKVKILRDKLIDGILKKIPKTRVNGTVDNRLCGNANFSFEGVEGESILLMLDAYGVLASTGSACSSNSL